MKMKRCGGLVAVTYTPFKTDGMVALPQILRGEVSRALLITVCQWLIAVALLTAMTRPASAQSPQNAAGEAGAGNHDESKKNE